MDVMNNVENVKTQMRRGVLEYCILSILSKKDSYASSILSELKEARMIVVEGTIYPLLIRQKNQGLLTYRWEESPQGQILPDHRQGTPGPRRDGLRLAGDSGNHPTPQGQIDVFKFFKIYKNAKSSESKHRQHSVHP